MAMQSPRAATAATTRPNNRPHTLVEPGTTQPPMTHHIFFSQPERRLTLSTTRLGRPPGRGEDAAGRPHRTQASLLHLRSDRAHRHLRPTRHDYAHESSTNSPGQPA